MISKTGFGSSGGCKTTLPIVAKWVPTWSLPKMLAVSIGIAIKPPHCPHYLSIDEELARIVAEK
jgi:hypothetical protein